MRVLRHARVTGLRRAFRARLLAILYDVDLIGQVQQWERRGFLMIARVTITIQPGRAFTSPGEFPFFAPLATARSAVTSFASALMLGGRA